MKKVSVIIAAFLLIISMLSCKGQQGNTGPTGPAGSSGTPVISFTQAPPNATILMNENFESYAVGSTPTSSAGTWQRIPGCMISYPNSVYNVVTNTAFVSYSQSLMIEGLVDDADREIIKGPFVDSIPNTLSGKIYANFYVRKDNTGTKGFTIYINQIEKARIDLDTAGGIDVYTSKTNYFDAGQYSFNVFNQYSFIINLSANTYDVYFNNVLIAQNIVCYNSVECSLLGSPILPADTIYPTCFGVFTNINSTYTAGIDYLDNIFIYYVPGA
jgi:hypothetical protein